MTWNSMVLSGLSLIGVITSSLNLLCCTQGISTQIYQWLAQVESNACKMARVSSIIQLTCNYKSGKEHVVANACSRRYTVLFALGVKVLGFHLIKGIYKENPYSLFLIEEVPKDRPYAIQEGYLSENNKVYIPKSSLRELRAQEAHNGSLAYHFDLNKTIDILKVHFYWPTVGADVHKIISTCSVCHKAKSQFPQGLYT